MYDEDDYDDDIIYNVDDEGDDDDGDGIYHYI
jgi:hypothetical protein